jgi:hypothetical protein
MPENLEYKKNNNKYYDEGSRYFHEVLDPDKQDNPYGNRPSGEIDADGWKKEYEKRGLWFDGFKDSAKKYFNDKYKIPELQYKIRNLIFSYGLTIEYDLEYDTPYGITPEGFTVILGEDQNCIQSSPFSPGGVTIDNTQDSWDRPSGGKGYVKEAHI